MTEIPTEALQAAARAYCLNRFSYPPTAYVDADHRARHIAADTAGTAAEEWFVATLTAAAPALIAEGRSMARYERELRAKIAGEIRASAKSPIRYGRVCFDSESEPLPVFIVEWAARIAEGTDHGQG